MKFIGLSFLLLFAPLSLAQSLVVFSNNEAATSCSEFAFEASLTNQSSEHYLSYCDRAIENETLLRADIAASYLNRGVINMALGHYSDAHADYLTAQRMAEYLPEVYLNLGNLDFLQKNFAKAIENYGLAEQLGLRQAHILYLNRGMALMNLGQLDAAEAQYMQALGSRPNWSPAQQKLEQLRQLRMQRDPASP